MTLKNIKIGFVGVGNMAEALIKGLIAGRTISNKNLLVSDVNAKRLKYIVKTYSIEGLESNKEVAKKADVVVLAVKPQVMNKVLSELSSSIKKKHLVVSIAAGIKGKSIKKFFPRARVVRVMPNNPALVGEGISAISMPLKDQLSGADLKLVQTIFESVGKTILVQEKLMDAVTALSGSGPGFVYLFAEVLIDGGIAAGLKYSDASKLAMQTIKGAARTMIESGKSPETLRKMVTSPGGTTLAGLRVFESHDLKNIVSKAIVAAAKRAGELSEGLN